MNKFVQIIRVPCNGYLSRVRVEINVIGTPSDYLHCAIVSDSENHSILQVSNSNFNSSTAHYAVFYFDYPVYQNQLLGIALYRDTENEENYFELPVFSNSLYPHPLYLDIDEDGEITSIRLTGCLRIEVEFENRVSERQDITSYVQDVNVHVGKGLAGDMLMGTASLTLRSANREFDIDNVQSPFFGIFKLSSKIYIDASIDVEPADWKRIFTGRITKIQPDFTSPYKVSLTVNDMFLDLQRRLCVLNYGSIWLETTSVVGEVLKQAGLTEDKRFISKRNTHYLQRVEYNATPALDILRDIVTTELHIHYIDGYGRYVFITSPVGWPRHMWYPQVTFTDDDYTSIAFDYDLTRVKNRIVVKYGSTETDNVVLTNPESIKRYGVSELKHDAKLFPCDVAIAFRLAEYLDTTLQDERGHITLNFEDGEQFFDKNIGIAQIMRIESEALGLEANYMICNINYNFSKQGKCSISVEAEAIPQHNPQIIWQVDIGRDAELVETYYFGVGQTFLPRNDDGNLIKAELLGITMSATNMADFSRDMKLELWQNNSATNLPQTKIAESSPVSFEASETKTEVFYFPSKPILSLSQRYSIVANLHWLPDPDYPSWSPTIRYFTFPNEGSQYINFSASASKLAQPFLANTSPNNILSAVQVKLRHYIDEVNTLERLNNITVTINTTSSNVPTDTVIASSSNWNYLSYDADGVVLNFAFTPPVTLTGGQVYALVINGIMSTNDNWSIDTVPVGEPLGLALSQLTNTVPTKIAFKLAPSAYRVAVKQVFAGGTMPFIAPLPNDLVVAIYDDDSGVPNQQLAVSEPYADNRFEFRDANLVYLTPNADYWLVFESAQLQLDSYILLTSSSVRQCYIYYNSDWHIVSTNFAPQGLTVMGVLANNAVEAWGRTDTTSYRAYYYDDDTGAWQYKTLTTGISGKLYYSSYSPPYDVYWKLPISASLNYADGKALSLNPDTGVWEGYDSSDAYDWGMVIWGWVFQ